MINLGCSGVAAGAASPATAVRRAAAGTRLASGTTAWAFVCSAVPRRERKMTQQDNELRVYRGGSWGDYSGHCRSASRDGYTPDFRFFTLGFRVLRSSEVDNKPQVFRGGSWLDVSDFCRSAGRDGFSPDYRYFHLGFRVIKDTDV
jgi:formylglycine-generating enzyme required for sulfatase activity